MKITASRCNMCERAIIPPRDICPYCGPKSGGMKSLELEARGVIASYTTLQMPPEGFDPPLTMALVELEHGAVVLCLAKDENQAPIRIGSRVELSLDSEERFQFQLIT